jgi:hypothetical protein
MFSDGSCQLEPAVAARSLDERGGCPARGARWLVGGRGARGDRREPFPLDRLAPARAHDLRDPRDLVLLDEEVGLGPSTLAAAGWAADDDGDARREAAIA